LCGFISSHASVRLCEGGHFSGHSISIQTRDTKSIGAAADAALTQSVKWNFHPVWIQIGGDCDRKNPLRVIPQA
jgi:hypothetical protein